MEPMMRSAQAFCHGDRGAVRTVCVFIPAMVVATSAKPNHDRGQAIAALGLRKSIARRLCRPGRRRMFGDRHVNGAHHPRARPSTNRTV